MSQRYDSVDPGSPARRYIPSEPAAPLGAGSTPPGPWASAAPPAPQPYPWLYPPPPEYYLPSQPSQQPGALPAPPPEHAYGVAYPAFAPDGRAHPAQAHGATLPGGVMSGARDSAGWLARLWRALLPPGSALVSFALYTWYGGWQFGLGLVLLLLVHEMGHFVVIRAKGLPAALPVFLPFLGAYVAMRRMPKNVRDEAEIALAGPLAGALGGAACFVAYQMVGEPEGHTLLFLAYFSFLINLLNLLPVSPLDGGHIAGAISRWLWPLGLLALAGAFFYTWNFLLLLLGWLWFAQTIARFRTSPKHPYYNIGLPARLYVTALYFGLAFGLALALYLTQTLMPIGGFFGQ